VTIAGKILVFFKARKATQAYCLLALSNEEERQKIPALWEGSF